MEVPCKRDERPTAKLPGFAEQFEGELLRDASGQAEESLEVIAAPAV